MLSFYVFFRELINSRSPCLLCHTRYPKFQREVKESLEAWDREFAEAEAEAEEEQPNDYPQLSRHKLQKVHDWVR